MMNMSRRQFCLASLLALAGARPAMANGAPLRLGLMPVYGVRALMTRYEPMRAYVARILKQPVRVETAPDFIRFLNRMLADEFDIAVAAAHFARIAEQDAGWVPLAQFEPDHDTLLIGRAGELPARPADLVGKEVAVIDRLAITVMAALQYLGKQGLKTDIDYRAVEYRNHSSVVHSLLSGASTLAVTTSHGLQQIPSDLRARVAVYRKLSDIPAFVIMGAPGMTKGSLERLRTAFLAFSQEAEGLEFLAHNSYTRLHRADEAAMRRADVFLRETRRMTGK